MSDAAVKTIVTAGANAVGPVEIVPMTKVKIIAVRATRVYLQTVVGVIGAGQIGAMAAIMPDEFAARAVLAMQIALAPAAMSALQNTLELLAEWDSKYPQTRA